MNENKDAVNTKESAATTTVVPAVESGEDYELKIKSLEDEKNKLIEETANWKLAALKAKGKVHEDPEDDEDLEQKMRRISQETLAGSRLAEIAREQDEILKKALKENKELKLAQLNKTTAPASVGSHTETTTVRDTLVTPEQEAALRARGWDDKKIERYKKNYLRYSGK